MPDESWPIIFSYSRAQAIEDGVLIDVTAEAKAYGFKLPFVRACPANGKLNPCQLADILIYSQ